MGKVLSVKIMNTPRVAAGLLALSLALGGCGGAEESPASPGESPGATSRPAPSAPAADNPLIGTWLLDAALIRETEAYKRSDAGKQERMLAVAEANPVELVFTADTVRIRIAEQGEPESYRIVARAENALKIVSVDAEGKKTEIDCMFDGDLLHIRNASLGQMTLRRADSRER
jgi:hypothetical protein